MFEAIKRMFARSDEGKMKIEYLSSEGVETGFYIVNASGSIYAGPYSREKDAKGQLTRLQRSYTPASRRPNKEA